jgi:hypothetical protein
LRTAGLPAAPQRRTTSSLPVGARKTGQITSVPGRFTRRARVPPAVAGRSAAASGGTGTAARRAHAPVPLGQIVRVRGADVQGEVCLLSYARVASGPQFSVFARTRQPSGPRLFDPFTAPTIRGPATRSPSATSAVPCSAGTGRNPAHDPWPAQLPGQHHHAHARQRPRMLSSLRAGRTLFLAIDMDMRQRRPLARHPHQRHGRNERRNRAAP